MMIFLSLFALILVCMELKRMNISFAIKKECDEQKRIKKNKIAWERNAFENQILIFLSAILLHGNFV